MCYKKPLTTRVKYITVVNILVIYARMLLVHKTTDRETSVIGNPVNIHTTVLQGLKARIEYFYLIDS